MTTAIYIIAAVGFLLSAYSLFVANKVKKNANYKSVCDLSNRASCTATFKSDYGKLFGIENGYWGILFYLLLIGLLALNLTTLLLIATVFGVLYSLRLGYILFFKMKNFCLICTSIHVVNFALLITSVKLIY